MTRFMRVSGLAGLRAMGAVSMWEQMGDLSFGKHVRDCVEILFRTSNTLNCYC